MADDGGKKKSRKERAREMRELEGLDKGCGVKYNLVADRHLDDKRYERELDPKEKAKLVNEDSAKAAVNAAAQGGQASAAFDAIMRMETGKPERSIADKINDPNRPSWEEYKQIKADKLDLAGQDQRKMLEYRAQLDKEREERLARAKKGGKGDKKKKKKKSKKRKRDDSDDSSDDSDDEDDDGSGADKKKKKKKDKKRKSKKSKKKSKKRRKKEGESGDESEGGKKKEKEKGPVRLSELLRGGGGDSSDDDDDSSSEDEGSKSSGSRSGSEKKEEAK